MAELTARVTRLGVLGLLVVALAALRALRRTRRSRAGTSACATRSATRRSSRGHAENYRLEPQLLAAVIYQESKFDPDARSASGAVGLMQLLPETGQGIADRTGGNEWRPEDLLNPSSTSATARGTSGTCSTSTATRSSRSRPTTPGRRTSTTGVSAGSGSSSPRRSTTSTGSPSSSGCTRAPTPRSSAS